MNPNRAGQAAWEFVVLVGFGVFVLFVMLVPLGEHLGTTTAERTDEIMYDLARAIQQELILAASVHPGLVARFDIPAGELATEVAKTPYRIANTNTTLILSYRMGDIVLPIPPVSGNLTNGTNLIRNIEGNVYVN